MGPNQNLVQGRQPILSVEQEELRGISRTVAEIEWLLLILVLLYLSFGGAPADSEPAISSALFFFAAFVMSFRYTNFYRAETRWKIGIETVAMLAFITWVLLFTGRIATIEEYLTCRWSGPCRRSRTKTPPRFFPGQ